MEHKDYHKELNIKKTLELREISRELPSFVNSFFISLENYTSILTRLGYANDLKIFFKFLVSEIPYFIGRDIRDIKKNELEKITIDDLYLFMDYLSFYSNEDDKFKENHERGKARKVSALRALFKYLFKGGVLEKNVCELLETPKIHEKPIIRLDRDEVITLLDIVEKGEGLSEKQLQYHKRTVTRDLAIMVLFLTTGIRVSELVSLNIKDIDFKNRSFVVTRKGGNRVILYFDEEVEVALKNYIQERKNKVTYSIESPLFLSMQNKRITVRAVEKMVKKYASIAAPLKKISPHKLRSTFGTMLYGETGDIYLVADVLGHKDVNTTRKHYAAMSEDNKRRASKAIKLRE